MVNSSQRGVIYQTSEHDLHNLSNKIVHLDPMRYRLLVEHHQTLALELTVIALGIRDLPNYHRY